MIPTSCATTAMTAACSPPNHEGGRGQLTRGWRIGSFVLGALLLLTPGILLAQEISNEDCLDCHTDPTTTRMVGGEEVSLLFPTEEYDNSVHAYLDCTECHTGIDDLVHESELPPPQCVDCHDGNPSHEKAGREFAESIHSLSHKLGASDAADCWDCHGSHGILPSSDPESSVFKLNLPNTCANCHSNEELTREYGIQNPHAADQYMESIHGRGLAMGLVVAPSCNDCHGVHDIKRSVDRDSPIHESNVSETCGECHLKVEQIYNNSIHGQLSAMGDTDAPICTDCHTAHEVETPRNGHFKMVSDVRCGSCHEESFIHYRDTYHGKAMALGKQNVASDVAACYDCHGHHDILPPSDPASHLSEGNILATCTKCHEDATVGFTEYQPHANPLDRENYPALHATFWFMTSLLVGVFTFFGIHTLAWLFRAVYLYRHDSKTFREAKVKTQKDDEWFTRFVPFERFLHFLVVTSFLLLVITGMPLKFYYTDWANLLFQFIGGAETARWLHRFGAVVTFLYFGLHLSQLVKNSWKRRDNLRDPETGKFKLTRLRNIVFGPDSMVPTLQDGKDFIAHNKWFFGKGPKPQFDRWTYWEKFDYLAVFWGIFIIGTSGLIMWFPQFFTSFLPGWIINVALIVHSDEALLAAGFIFSIHFFNTHFRLEKFPMDTVIFSGRISKTEMLHERKRWYDRLVSDGRLDDHRVKDEWEQWKNIARSFGYFFFGLGVILLILIIYAMATRLTH